MSQDCCCGYEHSQSEGKMNNTDTPFLPVDLMRPQRGLAIKKAAALDLELYLDITMLLLWACTFLKEGRSFGERQYQNLPRSDTIDHCHLNERI